MKAKHYITQKEKRILESIQRFRDFDCLTEPELEKLRNKEAWLLEYIKHHVYITLSNLAGDFMNDEWNMTLVGQHSTPNSEIRRILIYSFRPIIAKLHKQGVIERFNQKTYKVVNK